MFKMCFLFVLIAIFIFEPTHQLYQRSVPACSANGETFCSSCSTASFCITSAGILTQYNTTCPGTTVCGPDTSNPSEFECAEDANANCSCAGTTGFVYKSDPYSDQWYILCSGTTPAYIDCGDGYFYNEAEHNCVNYPPSPTTTTITTTTTSAPSICEVEGAGAHDDPETCENFYVCTSSSSDPILQTCPSETSYFDPVSNECKEPPLKFQCPPEIVGTFGDPFDCRRYYVCFNGDLFDVGCCGLTAVFNEQTGSCIAGIAPPGCPLSDECAEAFVTDNTIAGTSASTSSNSFTNSPSASTLEGITSTSTTTSPSISTSDEITSTSSTSSSTSTSDGISTTSSTSSATSTSDGIASPSTSTNTEITTTTESSTTISTTTNQAPICTPISSFECPAPDGFFPQCNYCARTYFDCVSGSATLGSCTGNAVFNTVPTYPSCIPPEYCPYYP